MYNFNLSKEDLQRILEALLYCASIELDHTQYQEDLIKITQLAINLRLKFPSVPTSNIIFVEGTPNPSAYTKEILKFFPEIHKKI